MEIAGQWSSIHSPFTLNYKGKGMICSMTICMLSARKMLVQSLLSTSCRLACVFIVHKKRICISVLCLNSRQENWRSFIRNLLTGVVEWYRRNAKGQEYSFVFFNNMIFFYMGKVWVIGLFTAVFTNLEDRKE